MISAFSHQMQSLVNDIAEQKQDLADLKVQFRREVEDFSNQLPEGCLCKNKLDSVQSQVKDNILKIDDLAAKFDRLEFQCSSSFASQSCSEMNETSSPFVDDNDNSPCFSPSWKAPGSREPTPNHIPEGYESPPIIGSPASYSAKEFFAAASFANPPTVEYCGSGSNVGVLHTKQPPNSPRKPSPWTFDNPKIKEAPNQHKPTVQQSCSVSMSNESMDQQRAVVSSQAQFSVENITSIAAENSHLKQQIVSYRQKVHELEENARVSDSTVADLRMIREHFVQKEREWNEKQDWYEHKLKLLKQDKRRRGETIGKLLKCIDDCKDSGRLEESRAKEGKAVLSATLHTRGMHTEDRIIKVVEAVEIDRVPRSPQEYPEPNIPENAYSSPSHFNNLQPEEQQLPQQQTPVMTAPGQPNHNRNNSAWTPVNQCYSYGGNSSKVEYVNGGPYTFQAAAGAFAEKQKYKYYQACDGGSSSESMEMI